MLDSEGRKQLMVERWTNQGHVKEGQKSVQIRSHENQKGQVVNVGRTGRSEMNSAVTMEVIR